MVIWRGINDLRGWRIEVTDPTYVSGVQRAWVSDPQGLIRGYGSGDTTAAAVVSAGADLLAKASDGPHFERWAAEVIAHAIG